MRAPLLQAAGGKVSADVSWGAVSLLVLLVFVVSLVSIAFTRAGGQQRAGTGGERSAGAGAGAERSAGTVTGRPR